MRRATAMGVLGVAAVLLLGACGHDHSDSTTAGHSHTHDMADTAAFGEPGDPSEADQEIEVTASDPFDFDPDDIEVDGFETITFVVTNEGHTDHEFVLGDAAYQEAHEEEMGGESHMEHGANTIDLDPGETESITWTFKSSGTLQYACHVLGHYEAGMFGTITIN